MSTISTLSRDTLYLIGGVLVVTEFAATGTVRQLLLGVLKFSKASDLFVAFSAGAGKPMSPSTGSLFSTARFLLLPLLFESFSAVRDLATTSLFLGVEEFSREVLLLLLLFLGGLSSSFVTTFAGFLALF